MGRGHGALHPGTLLSGLSTPDYLPLTTYRLPLTTYLLPLTSYHLLLTTYYLPLTTYHLPLATYYSLLATRVLATHPARLLERLEHSRHGEP